MLQRYPEPRDRQRVGFSDEVHLVGALKGYVSFESPDNGTALILFGNGLNQRKETKGEFIVGQQWVTTSRPTYISMIPATLMGR